MDITLVKQLRQKTGAGWLDCQQALTASKQDISKAIEILRKKGKKIAAIKKSRQTTEGKIGVYLHNNGKIVALVMVNCETDFVAKNKEFLNLVHDLAMQVAATRPRYLEIQDVPKELINKEKEIYRQALKEKPTDIQEKIIAGKLKKFYSEICLLEQPFIKDSQQTITELLSVYIARFKENIKITKFICWEI